MCGVSSELTVEFALTTLALRGKNWSEAWIRDNSVQKPPEPARQEAEEQIRLAIEENIVPTICTNLDDQIICANGAFCGVLGFSKKELIDFDSKPFTDPNDVGIIEESHHQ